MEDGPHATKPVTGTAPHRDDDVALLLDLGTFGPAVMAREPGLSVVLARFTALDTALLAGVAPARIFIPLMAPGHDATQVLERLVMLGFTGGVVVVTGPLPNAAMVQRELSALAPGMRLRLLELPAA